MIQLKSICVILFILPIFCKGQSICIDSSTLKSANIYLIKGAKAREQVSVLNKLHKTDSLYIIHQDSILQNNITELNRVSLLKDKYAKIANWAILASIILIVCRIL